MQTPVKEWIQAKDRLPEKEKKVKVLMSDGEETLGFINESHLRTCWLIQGTGGAFWREMFRDVVSWAEL